MEPDFSSFYRRDTIYEITIALALSRWRGIMLTDISSCVEGFVDNNNTRKLNCLLEIIIGANEEFKKILCETLPLDSPYVARFKYLMGSIFSDELLKHVADEGPSLKITTKEKYICLFVETRIQQLRSYLDEAIRYSDDAIASIKYLLKVIKQNRGKIHKDTKTRCINRVCHFVAVSTWPYFYFSYQTSPGVAKLLTRVPGIESHKLIFSQYVNCEGITSETAIDNVLYPTYCFPAKYIKKCHKYSRAFDLGWLVPRLPANWINENPLGFFQHLNRATVPLFRADLLRRETQAAMFDFYMLNSSALSFPIITNDRSKTSQPKILGYLHLCSALSNSLKELYDIFLCDKNWIRKSWKKASGNLSTRIYLDFKEKYMEPHDGRNKPPDETRSRMSTAAHEVKTQLNEIAGYSSRANKEFKLFFDKEARNLNEASRVQMKKVHNHLRDLRIASAILSHASQMHSGNYGLIESQSSSKDLDPKIPAVLCIQVLWHRKKLRNKVSINFANLNEYMNSIKQLSKELDIPLIEADNCFLEKLAQGEVVDNDEIVSRLMEECCGKKQFASLIAFSNEVFCNWRHFEAAIPKPPDGQLPAVDISLSRENKDSASTINLKVEHSVYDVKSARKFVIGALPSSLSKITRKYSSAGNSSGKVTVDYFEIKESPNGNSQLCYSLCFSFSSICGGNTQ